MSTTTSTESQGSVAEWSKALVLGTSHFDGVGSNPTAAKVNFFLWTIEIIRRETLSPVENSKQSKDRAVWFE